MIALSWHGFEFLRPANLSEAAPYIGQRIIHRRGAWLVEQYSQDGQQKPYPVKRVFYQRNGSCQGGEASSATYGRYTLQAEGLQIDCLPQGPIQLAYAFDADKPHLNAPGFSLTLRQDNWGLGYYDDLVPSFLQKRAGTN